MKAIIFVVTLLAPYAVALSSGIFGDDGKVVGARVARGLEGPEALAVRQPAQVTPTRRQETNAFRLRNGLPLLPPNRRRANAQALQPRASCPPLSSNQGKIQVKDATTGVVKGFVRKVFDGQNSYTFSVNPNDALIVSLPSISSVFDITAVNGPDAGHPLFGAVGGSGGYNFAPGQLGYAYLSGTGHTNANSPPSSTAGTSIEALGYNGPSESQIWSLDCLSLALTAQWTNVGGAQPSTSLFYDADVDFVGLVGDFAKFQSTFPGETAYLVTFTFIPA